MIILEILISILCKQQDNIFYISSEEKSIDELHLFDTMLHCVWTFQWTSQRHFSHLLARGITNKFRDLLSNVYENESQSFITFLNTKKISQD